jgi:hypothetical protein
VTNPATALHDLLDQVVSYGQQPVQHAWADVLGCKYGTLEFALRQCEVSALLRDALRLVTVLSESARSRYERYSTAWWTAVVSPNMLWNGGGHHSSGIISQADLDMLGSLGEVAESRFPNTLVSPADASLSGLRDACENLLNYVGYVRSIRLETQAVLRMQIEHLIWLIDNVDTFGTGRIVQEAQAAVTSVATATAEAAASSGSSDVEQQKVWRERSNAFIRKVAAFTVVGQLVFLPALTATADMAEQANRAIEAVADIANGPDGLERDEPAEPPAP